MELDLILDTSRKGIALGIYAAGKPVCEHFEPESRGENLGRILDAVLEQAKVALDDVKRVLVTVRDPLRDFARASPSAKDFAFRESAPCTGFRL